MFFYVILTSPRLAIKLTKDTAFEKIKIIVLATQRTLQDTTSAQKFIFHLISSADT